MMKAVLPGIVIVGAVVAIALIFVVIPWMTAKVSYAAQRRRVMQNARQRSPSLARVDDPRWLAARPTGAYRELAWQQIADAYADRRLSPVEHEQRVTVVETATANREIEFVLKDLDVVERPE